MYLCACACVRVCVCVRIHVCGFSHRASEPRGLKLCNARISATHHLHPTHIPTRHFSTARSSRTKPHTQTINPPAYIGSLLALRSAASPPAGWGLCVRESMRAFMHASVRACAYAHAGARFLHVCTMCACVCVRVSLRGNAALTAATRQLLGTHTCTQRAACLHTCARHTARARTIVDDGVATHARARTHTHSHRHKRR